MNRNGFGGCVPVMRDYGPQPCVINIDRLAKQNPYYRTALWTGKYLQVTLMSIPVRGDIGLERHPDLDQLIRIESGTALVMIGDRSSALTYRQRADRDYAIMIPAGTWHNVINIGNTPLKFYSVYAPPQHPFGVVHKTKAEAEESEKKNHPLR